MITGIFWMSRGVWGSEGGWFTLGGACIALIGAAFLVGAFLRRGVSRADA